ncbi:LPS export ABC transporter permease LptF [Biformimicrobium ophioploci]|uniref:Lipopolysaccharide export system permease protein LptF n=1 Tax=Biformimicrobium ophioploci TaxID=3036711 RepID=A0ABQ6LX95_9GAMM|nr:LPS export ABC transporter permease LptF [Microbulbifer sp. NKW57]GMG86739.1 LPS export ABC transporter permease LptF [Microbulbifer sp. NKW57]
MIIFRYLTKSLFSATVAVSLVLLLMVMSVRFVKYLAEAAAGDLSAGILFSLMGYRIPGFLELVLPLGFFVGILMAYGQLYVESEMTVLHACGFSERQLLAYTMIPALCLAAFVGAMSLYFTPVGAARSDSLLTAEKTRNEFDYLVPKKFIQTQGDQAVYYAGSLNEERSEMQDVFLAELRGAEDVDEMHTGLQVVTTAATGEQRIDPDTGLRYLVLEDGYRYEGVPGARDYRVMKFDSYEVLLDVPRIRTSRSRELDATPTTRLMKSDDIAAKATLHWRLSLPVLVIVVAMLAVPLSRTNPRQGRYAKMIPAVLVYFIYLTLLQAVRSAVEDGRVETPAAIWLVHVPFIIAALVLLQGNKLGRPRKKAPVADGGAHA